MILPHTYAATVALLILSMICWGSWASTYKLTRKWRFELYYFDFAIGMLLAAVIYAVTAGNLGFDGFSLLDDLMHSGKRQWAYSLAAGVIFNFANMLLMGAISVAGMAVAFPIGLGVAMIAGAALNHFLRPGGSPVLLLAGCALVTAAILVDAFAYRVMAIIRHEQAARAGTAKSTRRPTSIKGVLLALVSGVLMALFLPLVDKAKQGEIGLGPYSVAMLFAMGVFASTWIFNLFFMNLPVDGEPVDVFDYIRGKIRFHLLGIVGGAIWCTGAVASFVAATAQAQAADPLYPNPEIAQVSPALGFGLVQAAALVGALWGVLAWREFAGSDVRAKVLLVLMFVLFACGLALVSLAPTYASSL